MNRNWTYTTQHAQAAWLGQSCLDQVSPREGVRVPVRLAGLSFFSIDHFGIDQFDMNKTIVDHAPGGSSG